MKKISKKIFIPIIIAMLIISSLAIFLVVKNNQKSTKSDNEITNVNQGNTIDQQANIDILNQKICADFRGNYVYDKVVGVTFEDNVSIEDQEKIFRSIAGVSDKNSYIYKLNTEKAVELSKETISLIGGNYSRIKNNRITEIGLYFGNADKSAIFVKDKNGSTEIDETNYTEKYDISLTAYWLNNITNAQNNKIYIREKVFYGSVGEKYFYVTYEYKMI